MSVLDQAREAQLRNIEGRTGRTRDELRALVQQSGITRHSEIIAMLKRDLGMGHGDANAVALYARREPDSAAACPPEDDILVGIYVGTKAALRPIHDRIMAAIQEFGEFEIAPKKGYVSLRRKKQFAMVGPATNTRVEVGLNMKGMAATDRLLAMPDGGMCQYKVRLSDPSEVDGELIAWIRRAYDSAG